MLLKKGIILSYAAIFFAMGLIAQVSALSDTAPFIRVTIDEIDQHNGAYCGQGLHTLGKYAQSFIPTMNTLTKVLIPLWKNGTPDELKISIKSELEGVDLTSIVINHSQIGTNYEWYTLNFEDIFLNIGETYYIVWDQMGQTADKGFFYWGYGEDNPYPRGEAWNFSDSNWYIFDFFSGYYNIDFCFSQYAYNQSIDSDLYCVGSLSWSNINPGFLVSGEISVSNIGHIQSELNWEVDSFPDWGEWTFTPDSGTSLSPDDAAVIIDVFVVIPDESYEHFSGEVTIVNKDNNQDFFKIPVTVSTSKASIFQYKMINFFQNNPCFYPFLKYLL